MRNQPYFHSVSILLALLITACSSPSDCQKFRNGQFKMMSSGHTTFITRNGNIQKEKRDDIETTLNVKWTDACTYLLTPTEDTFKKMPYVPKGAFVKVGIIAINKNSYTQTSTSNFSDTAITAEVFKIE